MLSPVRKILKLIHPEGIPWPGALLYNAASKTTLFQHGYDALALDILSFCPEGNILDVGTGPGWLLLKLARLQPGLRLTGLDVSPAMVLLARKNVEKAGLAETVAIEEAPAGRMPFAGESFSAVVSTGSLHHWKDPVAGLNEVYRVLKPGGRVLIYDLVSDTPKTVLRELSRKFGRLRTMLLWLHTFAEPFYSSADLETLARSSLFGEGRTRFTSMLCCLFMEKGRGARP
jgi:ubiquinone/menaquinone biosynthesis C-methylase UbiE